MKNAIGVGVLLVFAARFASAQDTTSLVAGDRTASAELGRIIDATKQRGLPVEPILAKIRYAVLVAHAPGPRIVAVARAMAARLEEARAALAPHPTETDIVAGEDALSSHVSSQTLQDVRKVSANRPLAVPLGVLAQLVTNGVDERKAAKIVTDLIRRGATADQLVALGNAVNADVAVGTKANNAIELRMRGLNAVLGLPSANGDAVTSLSAPTSDGGKKKP